jgi:hypothetical protein
MRTTRKTKKVTPKSAIQYQSALDPAFFIHHNQTHRSASEAFRDADYATALWKCETELDRWKESGTWVLIWGLLLAGLYGLSYLDKLLK